jgi:hypothetical protein
VSDVGHRNDSMNRIPQSIPSCVAKALTEAFQMERDEWAFLKADAKGRAIEVATMAFTAARRKTVFQVLESSAAVIAAIDQGETLRRVFEVLQEVGAWWS